MADELKIAENNPAALQINKQCAFYHGTGALFDTFDFSKAGKLKDFGTGFYLTTDFAQAQKHAKDRVNETGNAYVYRYNFVKKIDESDGMKILELTKNDKKWLDTITRCRLDAYEPEYDIIYDRLADGVYGELGKILQQYSQGDMSVNEALEKIRWRGQDGDQYCFKSKQSLDLIKKTAIYSFSWRGNSWKMSREMLR